MHTRRDLRKASTATREKQIDLKRRQHGVSSYRLPLQGFSQKWRAGTAFLCFGIRES
jgi:hypothetical protein